MSGLAELLERVKAATGPDQDLDKALWYALIFDPALERHDDSYLKLIGSRAGSYTASLDASLALVERCGWRLRGLDNSIPTQPSVMLQSAEERRFDCEDEQRSGWGFHYAGGAARTAPLAVLAALLSARIDEAAPADVGSAYPERKIDAPE